MRVGPIGLSMWEIDTPALCLDIAALERNIAQLATFLMDKPAAARPHVKTHKSPAIAWLQLRAGAIGITCAKVSEAEVMAQAGIRNILIANQVVGADKIARLVNLAATTEVMVAVDDLANAQELSTAAQAKKVRLRVLVEVDVGMHRCGVSPGAEALALAREVVKLPGLRFEGLMGYEGHAVMIPDLAERTRVAHEAMAQLIATRDLLLAEGIPVGIVSAGGTGTYAITGAYPGVTEIQAGSYATMDAKYREVGMDFDQAVSVVARVVSVRGTDDAVMDAGLRTISPDMGLPTVVQPAGWSVVRLNDEHGILRRQGGAPLRRGDRVQLVPGHGCTTINLHDVYHVTRDGVVEAMWPVAARGCIR